MNDCPFCLENDRLEGEILDRDDWCYLVTAGNAVLTHDEWQSTRRLLKRLLDVHGPDGATPWAGMCMLLEDRTFPMPICT